MNFYQNHEHSVLLAIIHDLFYHILLDFIVCKRSLSQLYNRINWHMCIHKRKYKILIIYIGNKTGR